jgi:hypothetical protein
MQTLIDTLDSIVNKLPKDDAEQLRIRLGDLVSIYPFNEYEYIISHLLGLDAITLDEYYAIRDDYVSRNMYLYIFEISAPRGFGEQWAQGHLKELVPELEKPSKSTDDDYKGQYDFFLPNNNSGVKIEVKASRAVDFKSREALYVKALAFDSEKRFDMNFQQVKPKACDVFVWIAVWRDVIKYWVFSSDEVRDSKYYSIGQHRGNVGEGQLHLNEKNIDEFAVYEVQPRELLSAIERAYERQNKM